MELIEIAGYIASVLVGVSLGLIGGGGSILTVPVLVYLFQVDVVLATAYSLFIVGFASAIGSYSYYMKGLVNVKTAVVFGIPSIVAVFVTRAYIIPAIPNHIFTFASVEVSKNMLLMVLFALLMLFASIGMIRKGKKQNISSGEDAKQKFNYPLILTEGVVVGTLTGLVGAGGGFLIIPALVLLSKLPMKQAIGTSLVIVAGKSLIGFFGEGDETSIDWSFMLLITACSIVGIFIGAALARKIDGDKLKPAFGWFVLVMGTCILISELFF